MNSFKVTQQKDKLNNEREYESLRESKLVKNVRHEYLNELTTLKYLNGNAENCANGAPSEGQSACREI